jgi:hypothetical protein
MAKCPKCETKLSNPKAEQTKIYVGSKPWNGVYLVCPACETVLGASFDPLALAGDQLLAIRTALAKKR